MPPDITVGICCLNGAQSIGRTIDAVRAQTIAPAIELIVVDDGSTDDTASVAEGLGARVIRHARNRGPAAARNSVAHAASAPVVLYIDDDCDAGPDWAERHLRMYDDPRVVGTGGPVAGGPEPGWVQRYLARNTPAGYLDAAVGENDALLWRLRQYVARMWSDATPEEPVPAYAFAGGNMGFRRTAILAVGGFDERYAFGPEDYDLCLRVRDALPAAILMADPGAVVTHHYGRSPFDALRRSVSYGRNGGALYRRRPQMRLAPLPLPVLTVGLLLAGRRRPALIGLAALLPHLLHPGGLRSALRHRHAGRLVDAYATLAQETATDVGYLQVVVAGERQRDASGPAPDPVLLAETEAAIARAGDPTGSPA